MKKLKLGEIEYITVPLSEFSDEVINAMYKLGIVDIINETFQEKRKDNKFVPKEAILVLTICAKLQRLCALTDITVATKDINILEKLGFNLKETDDFFSEGEIRAFVNKYTPEELISYYNKIVEKVIKKMNYKNDIHQLDTTLLEVKKENSNYENSEITIGKKVREYKISCSRMMLPQGGIIEKISMTGSKTHDLKAASEILQTPSHLKKGDTLVFDRGYIDRNTINLLKREYDIDVIVPAKNNMNIFEKAVLTSIEENKWNNHPNRKRKDQKIHLVKDLGTLWPNNDNKFKKPENQTNDDVDVNVCVVQIPMESKYLTEDDITYKKKNFKYIALMCTNKSLTASEILRRYETRPEIEEDFRQLKDVWGLANFRSTKYLFIVFHVVTMLLGYMMYVIYKNTEEGSKYKNQSLETIIKNYRKKFKDRFIPVKKLLIFYKKTFGIINFSVLLDSYAEIDINKKDKIKRIIENPRW